jgi:hypothetical protein
MLNLESLQSMSKRVVSASNRSENYKLPKSNRMRLRHFFSLFLFCLFTFYYFQNVFVYLLKDVKSKPLILKYKRIFTDTAFKSPPLNESRLAFLRKSLNSSNGAYPNTVTFNLASIFDTNQPRNNPHNFQVILNPRIDECATNKTLLILALVIIAPGLFEKRQAIRRTWANQSFYEPSEMQSVFVVGLSSNETVNELVRQESMQHGDILAEDYSDSYFNITIKVMGAFKWTAQNCPNVEYILRINDHVAVNSIKLIDYLQTEGQRGLRFRNTIWGLVITEGAPIRDATDRWFVPKEEYPFDEAYLPYVEGTVILIASDLAFNVYNQSTFVYWPRFSTSMEDVYLGMLCLHLGANFFEAGDRFESEQSKAAARANLFYFPSAYSRKDMLAYWKEIRILNSI